MTVEMPRDPRTKGHTRRELTPEEIKQIQAYMKIQMENERQQELNRRLALAAAEERFKKREELNRQSMLALEEIRRKEQEAKKKQLEEESRMSEEARKKAEMERILEEIKKVKLSEEAERIHAEMQAMARIKGAKARILIHPEFRRMSLKAQEYVLNLKDNPIDVLKGLDKGDSFRLWAEKQSRASIDGFRGKD